MLLAGIYPLILKGDEMKTAYIARGVPALIRAAVRGIERQHDLQVCGVLLDWLEETGNAAAMRCRAIWDKMMGGILDCVLERVKRRRYSVWEEVALWVKWAMRMIRYKFTGEQSARMDTQAVWARNKDYIFTFPGMPAKWWGTVIV
jgi:hypothetical protein